MSMIEEWRKKMTNPIWNEHKERNNIITYTLNIRNPDLIPIGIFVSVRETIKKRMIPRPFPYPHPLSVNWYVSRFFFSNNITMNGKRKFVHFKKLIWFSAAHNFVLIFYPWIVFRVFFLKFNLWVIEWKCQR